MPHFCSLLTLLVPDLVSGVVSSFMATMDKHPVGSWWQWKAILLQITASAFAFGGQEMCSKAFGGKELSTTMNADECVARG